MTVNQMGAMPEGFVLNPRVVEVPKARDCLTPMGLVDLPLLLYFHFACSRVESMTINPVGSHRKVKEFVLNPRVLDTKKTRDCLIPMG